ncbi:hypothetical protein [Ralstonia sp.]|uniref:hypothetical protein n=1 Tax=Ralstonia sp. TaxID=54061 RepID=UPI002C4F2E7E|nr:hypothetical protein [Ralstonia sp.]HWV03732.1 hypothetical protein [Ralstonia sp.]
MLHVIDPDPEAVVPDKEAPHDPPRVFEEHRQLGEEMPRHQVPGPLFQSQVELVEIEAFQQMRQLGRGLQAHDHLFGRHHQFQQGWKGGDAFEHEVQVITHVVQTEAVVPRLGLVLRDFVDAVAQPVVVCSPVLGLDEVAEGQFGTA